MNEPLLKAAIFFGLAFVWLFFWNTAMILLVCRYVKTSAALKFFWICHAIICVVGFLFAAKILEIIDRIESISKGQRAFFGISLMLLGIGLPSVISMLSVKYFFPDKWTKYLEIKKTLWN